MNGSVINRRAIYPRHGHIDDDFDDTDFTFFIFLTLITIHTRSCCLYLHIQQLFFFIFIIL